ncbi:MAG: hypothetical protein RSC43_00090 [Clostridia bacterium]
MYMCRLYIYDVSSMVYAGTLSKFGVDYVDGKLEDNNRIKGLAVGGLRRILNDALLNIQQGSSVLFAFDSRTEKYKVYPNYKSTRERNMDVIIQLEMLKEICDRLKIPYVKQEGFEADDLIANIIHQYIDSYSSIEIISGDMDLAANILDKRVELRGSAAIYSSVNVDNFESVVKPNNNVPFNTILPFFFFYGKPSNNVTAFLHGDKNTQLYNQFLQFYKQFPAGYGSTNAVMAKFIASGYEDGSIPEDIAGQMISRMEYIYPKLSPERIPFSRVMRDDIDLKELQFFCRMLYLNRIAALYNRDSLVATTPFTREMQVFLMQYKDMLDSGSVAVREQVSPDMSFFINRTTAFTENIGDF